jgi:hypothetical protein
LRSLQVTPIFIGSNPTVSTYSRDSTELAALKNLPVFIASSTANHLADLTHALTLSPSAVFIEKGFLNAEEKTKAKALVKDTPAFIMSQYRYSEIFNVEEFNDPVVSCDINWTITGSGIHEWAYHLVSIDNYIKKTNNELYIKESGTYNVGNSTLTIQEGQERYLVIDVKTVNNDIHIELGKTNQLTIKNTNKKLEFLNEDCLATQIKDAIINGSNNKKLERL